MTKTHYLHSVKYKMSISQLILTHKYIYKAIWDNYIHTLQNRREILWWFFIFMEVEPFSHYFLMTKTPYLPSVKYKWAHIKSFSPVKLYKSLYSNIILIIYIVWENTVLIIRIYWARAIFLVFYDDQDTKSE